MTSILFTLLGIGVLATALGAAPARAALGEPAESARADAKALSAVRRAAKSHAGYSVEVLEAAGVTVREYVAPSGVVFAIAWNGLVHPDLSPLLGSYAGDYEKALRQTPRRRGRRSQEVRAASVVVQRWGRMRSLHGRAWAPALVPAGVKLDAIR